MTSPGTRSDSHAARLASDNAAKRFLHDLVATPSVSGDERAAVERFVHAARALGLGGAIDEAGNGVAHRRASGAASRSIVLLGHIDTVPGNIHVRLEEGVLFGRGSVDAKGPLAAMLFGAVRASLPDNVEVHVVAAVGEETAHSPGAHHIATALRPDACIIAEPSGWDGVTLGYKGCLTVRATVVLENAHTAGPQGSAADELLTWWQRVQQWMAEQYAPHAQVFDQLQGSVLAWDSTNDGLTTRAAMTANFRLPNSLTPDALEVELARLANPGIELNFVGGEAAHLTTRSDPVVRALSTAIREHAGTPRHKRKTGTADFNVVGPRWNCPIAAYGPGDSTLDHTPNERLEGDEFLRSIRVITSALEHLSRELTTSAD